MKVLYGGLFDFSVSLNQTSWFRVFVDRLRFGFELENFKECHNVHKTLDYNKEGVSHDQVPAGARSCVTTNILVLVSVIHMAAYSSLTHNY